MFYLLSVSFDYDFYPLLVIVGIAWLIPMLMSVFRLNKVPAVIIEIIAGFFIGKYLLQSYSIEDLVIVDFLALTGFIFLMFLGGLEINVDQIIASFPRKKLNYSRFIRNPFLVGIFIFMATLGLSYAASFFISGITVIENRWYFALIMITTSVGIILPVLKNRGEINTRYGQMIVLSAAVADVLSILLFTITAFLLKEGLGFEMLWLLLLLAIFLVLYFAGTFLRKFDLYVTITHKLSHAASQIKVRGTILLILVFVVASRFIGTEVILLGAFLGGLLLSFFLHKDRSLLLIKLDGMGYGFFIPVFFIFVGITFEPEHLFALDQSLLTFLLVLLITLFAVKVLPSLIWTRLFGFRKAVAGGFLISSRLSLIIAASTIGVELEVISQGINACFILMAVLTCLFSPLIFNFINPPEKIPADKTVIIGGSSTAVLLARRLFMHNRDVVIVDKKLDRSKEINAKGIPCIYGDGRNQSVYEKINLKPWNYIVILTDDDQLNIDISRIVRQDLNHERVITKANKRWIQRALNSCEVEYFDATRVIATTIESLILRPTVYHTFVESFENFSLEEIKLTDKELDGLTISDIPIHRDATIILIRRVNELYIPHGDTYLRMGDVLNILGTPTALEHSRELLT